MLPQNEFYSKFTKARVGYSSDIPNFCPFSFSMRSPVICMVLYLTVPTALVQSTYPMCLTTRTHGPNRSLSEWPLDEPCYCCWPLWTAVFGFPQIFACCQEQWMNHSGELCIAAPEWTRILHNSSTCSNLSFASMLRESQGKFMLNA